MILQLIGPQACGKGTQGEYLSQRFGLPLVGVGDLLRDLPIDFPDHDKITAQMEAGGLVDYQMTAKVLEERVSRPDCKDGYILDGWGRAL